MNSWTQEQAIAFECAREAITDLMAIQTRQIAEESGAAQPNAVRVAELRAVRARLAQERADLLVSDQAQIARIRTEYGAQVRAWRAEHQVALI